jgi:anti-sigma B factor antagonist
LFRAQPERWLETLGRGLCSLTPQLDVVRVGLAENWRGGLASFYGSIFSRVLPNCEGPGKLDGMPIPPRSKNFSIGIRHSDQASLIDVVGSLTLFESAALRQAITNLIAEKRRDIVLNLSRLEYLDSSGIGELVRNYLTVIKSGGSLKVVGLSNRAEEILKITQLYKVFPEFPDEEAALKSYPPNSGSSKS